MKPLLSKWSPLRWRFWVIGITVATISSGASWSIQRWQHRRSVQRSIRILKDLRIVDAASTGPLDLVTGRSNVCEVHGVEMSVDISPVLYGCLERSTRNSRAVLSNPHARWPYEGGCIVMSAPVARAFVCPECVARAAGIPPSAAYANDASTTDVINAFWQPKPYLPELDFPKLK
jgi:hypothetical protein